ncbi:hypothetical protein GCM10011611_20660 [Aliidongia dinghuensis]|uniref:Uncharacterized protein n=1 Tax=Aliidongia dinghuensis TaxID=1867774 RepID=A0A8J3E313_9PROT|nr:hypothetical protein [Aliidongia dinghuensis]GGF14768.1 hypothetical protein GCM10011611_20660 [Aliidongia dinghuensis]
MPSFFAQLASFIAGPAKPAAAPAPARGAKPPAAAPKSAERQALEQSILANRRKILTNMAAMQQEREAALKARGISSQDMVSAAEIARRILLDQGNH